MNAESKRVEVACPHCGEMVLQSASLCRYCQQELLSRAYVATPIGDGRERYQVARAVASLLQGTPFSKVLAAIENSKIPLLEAATQQTCRQIEDRLQDHGVKLRLELVSPKKRGFSPRLSLRVGLIGGSLLLASGALGLFALRATAPSSTIAPSASSQPLSAAEVAEKTLPSLAMLSCRNQSGTGFFVATDELITNAHVVCDTSDSLTVRLHDGRKLKGTVTASDEILDIALVNVPEANAVPVQKGDAGSVVRGETVYAFGNPMGNDFTLTRGIVSHPARFLEGYLFIQTDASVNPGNSGGPLLNEQGRVVGIVSLKRAGEGLGLALPINYLYDQDPQLTQPPDGYSSERWMAALEQVKTAENQEQAELAEVRDKPILVEASYARGAIVARVVLHATVLPSRISFALEHERRRLCSLSGGVTKWLSLDELKVPGMGARTKKYLEESGELKNTHMTVLFLSDLKSCALERLQTPPDLVLPGGAPNHDRVTLRR